jgi:hypothetical protein
LRGQSGGQCCCRVGRALGVRAGRMAAVLKRLSMSKDTSPTAAAAGAAGAGDASSLQKSFKEQLSAEAIAFFNEVTQKPFSAQATAFLSAYWKEVGDQAEFIYAVSGLYGRGLWREGA